MYRELFEQMHPNFFETEQIRGLPPDEVYEEMVLELRKEAPALPSLPDFHDTVFQFYSGPHGKLIRAVCEVEPEWKPYFTKNSRVFCAMVNNEIASFCLVEDMGFHQLGGRTVRVGGPGCVGTVPAFRRKGIGAAMVRRVAALLRGEGFDLSYIHYTHIAHWYAAMGYQTVLRWSSKGFLSQ